MPVLLTATTIALLLTGGGKNRASFLNPASVLEHLQELPASETRDRAIALASDYERFSQDYTAAATAALEAYADEASLWNASADSLIARMEPQDAAFARLLDEIIRVRQTLLDTLTPEEWDTVFA